MSQPIYRQSESGGILAGAVSSRMSRFARFAVWACASCILLAPSVRADPASTSGVSIDWGALDALGPAKTHSPGVVLKRPAGEKPKTAGKPQKVMLRPPPKHVAARAKPPVKQAALPAKPPATPKETLDAPQAGAPPPPNLKPIAPPPVKFASTAHAPLPPAPAVSPTAPIEQRVSFPAGTSELSPDAQTLLDGVAARMSKDAQLRLELVAYAGGTGDDNLDARRLSRARAEAMRAYLVEKGVGVVRVDLRALGRGNDDGRPADRVDLVFLEH